MRLALHGFLILTAAVLLSACADDPVIDPVDGNEDVTDTEVESDVVLDNLVFEDPTAELADCFDGCENDANLFRFPYTSYDGMRGIIDGECHTYINGKGPDIDVMAITSPVGTALEITVMPAPGSKIDPLVMTHDGSGFLTYNDRGPDGVAARTVLLDPTLNDLPLYIVVNDARNYENFDPKAYYDDCSTMLGGEDYAYIVSVRVIPDPTKDLGTLDSGNPSVSSAELLATPGDTNYYRFKAPANARPEVTLFRTGNAALWLAGVGLKTLGGDLAWNTLLDDEDGDGALILDSSTFRACDRDCTGELVDWGFAVFDWDGFGGSDYTYDLTVSLQ